MTSSRRNAVPPEVIVTLLGHSEAVAIFRTENGRMVVGGKVREGKVQTGAKARVWRGARTRSAKGAIDSVQAGKQQVREILAGQECGLSFRARPRSRWGPARGLPRGSQRTEDRDAPLGRKIWRWRAFSSKSTLDGRLYTPSGVFSVRHIAAHPDFSVFSGQRLKKPPEISGGFCFLRCRIRLHFASFAMRGCSWRSGHRDACGSRGRTR